LKRKLSKISKDFFFIKNEAKYCLFFFAIVILLSVTNSCNFINPSEKIPSYIHIDSFTLLGNYDSTGSLSHNITDVWVIVDNDVIGAFELPATIPILINGTHKLYLRAGIKENGISNTRVPYPFYNYFSIDHNFYEASTSTFNPKIWYVNNNIKMVFNEDFEGSNIVFDPATINNATLFRTNVKTEVYEGDFSYKIVLPQKNDIFEIDGEDIFDLPRNKSNYIEINFKTDVLLTIGYKAIGPTNSVSRNLINLNPTKKWKKIYINLGSELIYEDPQYNFQFIIGAVNTLSDTATIFLDNIKMLTYY